MEQTDQPAKVASNDQLGPVVEVRGMLANGVQIPLAVRGVYELRDGKTGVYVTMPDADDAPQAPLTEAQIEDCIDAANRKFNGRRQGPCGQQMTTYDDWKHWLAREIESAHGIRA